MIEVNDIVAIGKFQKTHALKGELNAILEIDSEFLEEGNAIIAIHEFDQPLVGVESDGLNLEKRKLFFPNTDRWHRFRR